MPIVVSCECGRSLRVKEELAGRKIRCPDCAAVVVVPAPAPVKGSEDEASGFLLENSAEEKTSAPVKKREVSPIAEGMPPPLRAPEPVKPPPAGIAKINKLTKKMRKRKADDSEYSGIAINPLIITGLLMMVGAVVWFVAGLLAANRIYFYPPILFVLGIGTVIKGFTGRE